MSRTIALSPLTVNTQRVNAAVGVAVRRKMNEATSANVDNRQGLAHSIGKRIQGTYGMALRDLAESAPELSAAELCEAIVFPGEYPEDFAPDEVPASGDRDRARRTRPNAPSPDDLWQASSGEGWAEGLADAKASLTTPVRKPPPIDTYDPRPEVSELRAALDAGKVQFQEGRRARHEVARANDPNPNPRSKT